MFVSEGKKEEADHVSRPKKLNSSLAGKKIEFQSNQNECEGNLQSAHRSAHLKYRMRTGSSEKDK